MKRHSFRRAAFLVVMALAFSFEAAAQPDPSRFTISGGFFPTNFSTSARLDSEANEGSDVDLEDDLGLRSSLQNFRLDAAWRFTPRQRLELGYTSWRRSGDKDITSSIDWGDKHFDVGANVGVSNNAQFIKLGYRFSFLQTDRYEVAAAAGIDMIWNETTLEGEATIIGPNGGQETGFYSEDYDYVAPAPVLGIDASYLVTPKVLLRGSTEYFQATFEETTAKVLDFRGSADWLFSPTWSAGFGYTFVGFKIERERFDAEYDFSGPIIYLTYRR